MAIESELPYRVLVVDDSAIVRRIIRGLIATAPQMGAVEEATNGRLAIEAVQAAARAERPYDLVLLDVEMPEMDGLTALPQLLGVRPPPNVIMVSAITSRGAAATVGALTRGASDYICKPDARRGVDDHEFAEQLVAKLRVWGAAVRRSRAGGARPPARREADAPARSGPAPSAWSPPATASSTRADLPAAASSLHAAVARPPATTGLERRGAGVRAIAIGCSTGGPQALLKLLEALGGELPCPIFITQHMPPGFTNVLAKQLARVARRECHEVTEGLAVQPGHLYLAAGGRHLGVELRERRLFVLPRDEPPENFCRPAVDPMLRELAAIYGRDLLTVILTGMGQDGMLGCRAVAAAQGRIIAQDRDSCVVWGMPGAVVRDGLADAELPLDAIAPALRRLLRAEEVRA